MLNMNKILKCWILHHFNNHILSPEKNTIHQAQTYCAGLQLSRRTSRQGRSPCMGKATVSWSEITITKSAEFINSKYEDIELECDILQRNMDAVDMRNDDLKIEMKDIATYTPRWPGAILKKKLPHSWGLFRGGGGGLGYPIFRIIHRVISHISENKWQLSQKNPMCNKSCRRHDMQWS